MTECSIYHCDEDAEYSGRPVDVSGPKYRDLCRDCAMELSGMGNWDVRQKESGEP